MGNSSNVLLINSNIFYWLRIMAWKCYKKYIKGHHTSYLKLGIKAMPAVFSISMRPHLPTCHHMFLWHLLTPTASPSPLSYLAINLLASSASRSVFRHVISVKLFCFLSCCLWQKLSFAAKKKHIWHEDILTEQPGFFNRPPGGFIYSIFVTSPWLSACKN